MKTIVRVVVLSFFPLLAASSLSAAELDSSKRWTVVISDLHMGVGKRSSGEWNAIEDFRWSTEFSKFLDYLTAQSGGTTDLVLNGDTFEMWQSLQGSDCRDGRSENESCTEKEAAARFAVILTAHDDELKALKRFSTQGSNRVFFVPGNHDVALRFASIAAELLRNIGGDPERVRVLAEGYFLSGDKAIYAEHGHDMDDLNAFKGSPPPFRKINGTVFLDRPWGENMVQSFYNRYEEQFESIDNIAGELNGVKYGMASIGIAGTVGAIRNFAGFFLFRQSFRQFGDLLSDQDTPAAPAKWNLKVVRDTGDQFFVDSIPSDDPIHDVMQAALKDGQLGLSMSEMKDEELTNICDYRFALLQEQLVREHRKKEELTIDRCEVTNLNALRKKLVSLVDETKYFSQHLDDVRNRLRKSGKMGPKDRFSLFVYSHTHTGEAPYDLRKGQKVDWHPAVTNTGAWQRIVTVDWVKRYQKKKHISNADLLGNLKLDNLPPCYPAIIVRPYGSGKPAATLEYWQQDGSGEWVSLAASCN